MALGTPVPYARASAQPAWAREADEDGEGDEDRTDAELDTELLGAEPLEFEKRHKAFLERLLVLHKAGLPLVHVLSLARVWTQGGGVHVIRAVPVTREWSERLDGVTTAFVVNLLGMQITGNQNQQLSLPLGAGGVGLGSYTGRYAAAWLAAWEGGLA